MSEPQKEPARVPANWKTSRCLVTWAVGGLAIVVVAWFFLTTRSPGTPFTLKRNSAGEFVPVSAGGEAGASRVSANLEAATIAAQNSISSLHSSSHTANAAFACRSVAILNYSDHPLLKDVGEALPEQLAKLWFINEVNYYPPTYGPAVGSESPDLWITLDLSQLNTFGMQPRFTVEAQLEVTAGSSMDEGSYRQRDQASPPIVEHLWRGTIDHKSTITGISTDKFSLVAKNISAALAKQLTDFLQKSHDEYGPLPPFDAHFYPDYTPTPEHLNFDDWDAELLASTHGLMSSNETSWRVTTVGSVPEMLKAARDRFEQSGWKTEHFNESEQFTHLSMSLEEDRLDIFVKRDAQLPTSQVTIRFGDADSQAESDAPAPRTVVVRYVNRLSRPNVLAATDRQLAQGGPIPSLLALSSLFRYDQRAQFVELLETQHANSPQAWLTLADEYSNMNQPEKTRGALRRAYWLSKLDPASNDQHEAVKKRVKKLKAEEILREQTSAELLRELGLAEIKAGEETEPVEVGLDQPALFFALDEQGDWHALNWRVQATDNDATGQRYRVLQAHVSRNMSSWGSGHLLPNGEVKHQSQRIPELGMVTVAIQVLDDERFRFIGQLEPQ